MAKKFERDETCGWRWYTTLAGSIIDLHQLHRDELDRLWFHVRNCMPIKLLGEVSRSGRPKIPPAISGLPPVDLVSEDELVGAISDPDIFWSNYQKQGWLIPKGLDRDRWEQDVTIRTLFRDIVLRATVIVEDWDVRLVLSDPCLFLWQAWAEQVRTPRDLSEFAKKCGIRTNRLRHILGWLACKWKGYEGAKSAWGRTVSDPHIGMGEVEQAARGLDVGFERAVPYGPIVDPELGDVDSVNSTRSFLAGFQLAPEFLRFCREHPSGDERRECLKTMLRASIERIGVGCFTPENQDEVLDLAEALVGQRSS